MGLLGARSETVQERVRRPGRAADIV